MYAIVYKEDRVPMCARLRADGPDAVVYWNSEDQARGFLSSKGDEFVAAYDIVPVDDSGLHLMAEALGCRDEDLELIPFPSGA
jgi:hypothetical protein